MKKLDELEKRNNELLIKARKNRNIDQEIELLKISLRIQDMKNLLKDKLSM